uniref:Lipase_3 domain-containing protein n=1 Tax=Heterorhabditis bacteriophora TaxID=37862 RepID=A0A1I7XC88_HETBA
MKSNAAESIAAVSSIKWCVESNACGGPLSCPIGKPVVQRDPFRCPTKYSVAKGKRYTDALGRSLFAVALSLKHANVSDFVQSYKVECDSAKNMCGGLVAVSEEAKALYVAYKGSSFDKQLLAEFIHGMAAQLGAWEKFESDDGGITGHSLGGSLASMTALHLVKNGLFDKNMVRLVTYGEPRTGNVAYAKEVEKHVPFRYRVIKKNDMVKRLPSLYIQKSFEDFYVMVVLYIITFFRSKCKYDIKLSHGYSKLF